MRLIRRTLQLLALIQDSPRRTAMAFSLGVFLGFSPLIGIHTVLGLFLAYALRLSKVGILVGVYMNSPWLIVPYYGFATWFGVKITGMPEGTVLPHLSFSRIFGWEFWQNLLDQYHLLIPAVVGSTVLAVLFALLAYPVALHALQKLMSSRRHTMAAAE
ncbi:MAG: DUF2062 domain-containing protein [Acidobacteriota bacterium]